MSKIDYAKHPALLLALFSFINFLIYYDRGTYSASRSYLIAQFNLSAFQYGFIGSVFLIGYSLSGPLFSHFSNKVAPFRLVIYGTSAQFLACIFSALSFDLFFLILSRLITGIGEASFLCIAPTFIDALSPKQLRAIWLAVFYSTIAVGYACGIILSGQILDLKSFGDKYTQRFVFIMQSFFMIICTILLACIRGPQKLIELKKKIEENTECNVGDEKEAFQSSKKAGLRSNRDEYGSDSSAVRLTYWQRFKGFCRSFISEILVLLKNGTYISIVLGYAGQTFVVGGFAIYGSDYVRNVYNYDIGRATLYFGIVTVITGVLGTFCGGLLLDFLRRRSLRKLEQHSSVTKDKNQTPALYLNSEQNKLLSKGFKNQEEIFSLPFSCFLLTISSILAIPICFGAFQFHRTPATFFALIFFAEFILFSQISPINATILWLLPLEQRSLGISISVVTIHLLGDALSPPFIGFLIDKINCNTQKYGLKCNQNFSMLVGIIQLIFPCLFFGLAQVLVNRKRRKFLQSPTSFYKNENIESSEIKMTYEQQSLRPIENKSLILQSSDQECEVDSPQSEHSERLLSSSVQL